MKLLLKRIALRPTYTIGRLFIDDERFCDTLEDKVRDHNKDGDLLDEGEQKVYSETAIPYGCYSVTLKVQSQRFRTKKAYQFCKGFLPRLVDVPHFEGILIHIGNKPEDSAGCILVGENKIVGGLVNSTATFNRLYERLAEADKRGEEIEIEIM